MDKSPNRHIDFLDPLRGIAILLVFIFHSVGPAFGRDELPWGHWFRDFNVSTPFIFLIPATFGWVGVAIFFVVSGFCIHLSFSRLPQWSLFFQRRFFRIYPPYLVTLLFFAVIFPTTRLAFTSWHSAGQFVSHLFLFHNIDDRSFFGINPSYWSIAVEVQLYALYPILIMLARRFGWRRTLIGLAMIEITLRFTDGVLFTFNGTGLPRWISGSPFFFWFSWALGASLAERYICGKKISVSQISLYAVGLAAVASVFFKPFWSMSFLLFALLTAGVVAKILNQSEPQLSIPIAFKTHLQQVGIWSFSLYLLHQPFLLAVPMLVAKIAPGAHVPPTILFLFCLMLWIFVVPLARLCYQFCELPSIALGKNFQATTAAPKRTSPTR